MFVGAAGEDPRSSKNLLGMSIRGGTSAVEKHPPATGSHVQKELHKRQEVVVVVGDPAEGAAQCLELWGQRHPLGWGKAAFTSALLPSELRGAKGITRPQTPEKAASGALSM